MMKESKNTVADGNTNTFAFHLDMTQQLTFEKYRVLIL